MTDSHPDREQTEMALTQHARRVWVWTGAAIVLTAIIVRLTLNFRYALPPATDGAYYPMQTWWLIEHGRLMYNDLPLMFWLNSAAAHVIRVVAGMDLEAATVLGSRLIDGVAQPWVAVPILMLGYTWSAGRRGALLGCAAAAVLAVMSPPIIRMASDFQKNSLGLVWMLFAMWAIRQSLAHRRSVWRWGLLAVIVVLAGLTHIGAFGVTCVMLGATAVAYRFNDKRVRVTRVDWIVALLLTGGVGALIAGMLWLEPSRTVRLLSAPWRVVHVNLMRMSPPAIAVSAIVYGLLALVVRRFWGNRDVLRCDRAVVMGAAAAVAVLVFPFLEGDYAGRFLLMTPVPGAVLIAFVMCRRALAGEPRWPAVGLAMAALLLAFPAPYVMQGPAISTAAADELRSFRAYIDDPTRTLVVAPHGVVYWAGLVMRTPVRLMDVPDDAFTRYARVLMLQPKADASDRKRPPSPGGRDRHGPPARPMRELTVPDNAELVHGGKLYNLYEVRRP